MENKSKLDSEREWKLAQMVTQLVAERFSRLNAKEGFTTSNDATLSQEIEAALRRAKLILHCVENPQSETIQIHRAFNEGEQMSENKVTGRLLEIGWGERQKGALKNRLRDVRTCWQRRLARKRELVRAGDLLIDRIASKLRIALGEIGRDSEVVESFPEYNQWSSGMIDSLIQRWPIEHADEEGQRISWEREQCLFHWCVGDELGEKGGVSKRNYRPHELFRFTEAFEWFPEEFRPQPLNKLAEDFTPGTPRSRHLFSFDEFQNSFWATKAAQEYLETLDSGHWKPGN